MQSRSGLRQALRGRGKRRPAQACRKPHKGKSRRGQDCPEINSGRCTKHQGYMRQRRPPHPKEGKTGDHQYPCVNPPPQRKTAVASPKAREIVVTRRSGPEHAEVPPMKERPAVGGRKPLNNHLERVEEEREDFSRRRVKRTGDQQRTPGRQNSNHGSK